MVDVKVIDNKVEWNKKLKQTLNYNVFSTYEWGEYKSNSWIIERLAFYKSGNFLGQCQFLIKKKLNLLVSWNSGGINLVDFKNLPVIVEAINKYYGDKKFNLRFNFYDKNQGSILFDVVQAMQPSKININSGFSILHDLTKTTDTLKQMNSNHRYYYKKSLKNNLEIKFSTLSLIDNFINLHDEMTAFKNLQHLKINKEDICRLSNSFDKNFLIVSVYKNNKVVSSCLILLFENSAFYYLAASNEEGRKTYSSYFMIKELFEHLRDIGIEKFDFAGITPYDLKASGVNKFKIGFGGEIVKYLGEYELYNSNFINFTFNKIVKFIK